jgi:hypothetical protein
VSAVYQDFSKPFPNNRRFQIEEEVKTEVISSKSFVMGARLLKSDLN